MTDEPISVVFNLACNDPRAWVVLSRDGVPPRVIEMWQPHLGFWSACAVVSPGEYRCECGMDTLLILRKAMAPDAGPFMPDHRREPATADAASAPLA
jgi:hypothetical protein